MAKVVISRIGPVSIQEDSFLIYDHDVIGGKIYYKFRVNLTINDPVEALRDNFEIRLTRQSPFTNRPNMFKNESVTSTSGFLSKIKDYDKKRIDLFKRKVDIVKKVPIIYQDLRRGFVEFTIKDPGTQAYYATLTKINDSIAQNQQMVIVNNDVLISRYAVPNLDFVVGSSRVFRNTVRIVVTPNDKRISKFKIVVYDAYGNSDIDLNKSLKYTAQVTNEGKASIDIPDTGNVTRNIRVSPISYYRSVSNNLYKEIVINDQKMYSDKCIIFPISFTGKKAVFSIKSLPDDVIYVKLLRKNLTKSDRNPTIVTGASVDSNRIVLEDLDVFPYCTFLYYAQFEFKDGTQRNSAAFYVLSPKYFQTNIALNVSESGFVETSTNVTRKFNAIVDYKSQTSTQTLLNDLKQLGIDNIFPNEIKNLSTQLDPLIGILVTRIDSISCSEQKLGVFKQGEIEDTFRKDAQCVYIFEVLIKSPSEVIEDISSSRDFDTAAKGSSVGDPMIASRALGLTTFRKKVNFTQKFFNKSALYLGTLRYGKTLSSLDAGIESGRTSIFKSLLIYPNYENPEIRAVVSTIRENDKIVSWTSTGNINVDDFSIIDTTTTDNVVLGKVNAEAAQTEYVALVPSNVKRIKIQANLIRGEGISFEADI